MVKLVRNIVKYAGYTGNFRGQPYYWEEKNNKKNNKKHIVIKIINNEYVINNKKNKIICYNNIADGLNLVAYPVYRGLSC
jgi:hypothetical protein